MAGRHVNSTADLALTFTSWLSRSTGMVSWQRWSVSVHSRHTQLWSLLQNSSKSLWCRLHILFSSVATGSVSLWIFKVATLMWGSRWRSQYEVRHTRHDFRALVCFPMHTSQRMVFPAADVTEFCLLDRIWSDISLAKEFSQSSGRLSNTVWHLGQLTAGLSSQWEEMHVKQKLWPQGMETGSEKTSWQMQHWNWTSDRRMLGQAMISELQKVHHHYLKQIGHLDLFTLTITLKIHIKGRIDPIGFAFAVRTIQSCPRVKVHLHGDITCTSRIFPLPPAWFVLQPVFQFTTYQ